MFGQGPVLALIGLVIVFAVLSMLAAVVALIRRVDDRWQEDERAAEQAALEKPPGLDSITLVLIAAAVATYLQGRFRIRRVRRLFPHDAPSSPWSHQGRLVLMGSHLVRGR